MSLYELASAIVKNMSFFFKDGLENAKRASFIDQKLIEDLLEAKCNCNFLLRNQ